MCLSSPRRPLSPPTNAGEVDVLDNLVIGSQAQSQYSGSEELKSYDLVGPATTILTARRNTCLIPRCVRL